MIQKNRRIEIVSLNYDSDYWCSMHKREEIKYTHIVLFIFFACSSSKEHTPANAYAYTYIYIYIYMIDHQFSFSS